MSDSDRPRRVLLAVDDEEDMRFLMTLCFDGTEYEVRTARNGAEALELIGSGEIDLVFLDLRMPVLDGWGVLEQLRESSRLSTLPVVVVSAHASAEASERALQSGATRFLSKPYSRDDVLRLAAEYAPVP